MVYLVNSFVFHIGKRIMANLKIVNRSEFIRSTRHASIDAIKPAIDIAIPKITKKIKQKIITLFRRHPTVLGLAGKFEGDENLDLQAIFGLDDYLAASAVQEILQIVEDSIQVTSYRRGTQYRFLVKTDSDLMTKIGSIASGSYEYEKKTVRFFGNKQKIESAGTGHIDWISWLLNGATAQADLTFDLNQTQQANSRSGRAIMELQGYGYWTYEGSDFIQEITEDPELLDFVTSLFKEEIKRQVDKL